MRNLLWVLLFVLITLRVFLYHTLRPSYPDGTKIRIEDKLATEPVRYDNSQYLRLSGLSFYLPLYPEVTYGDSLIVEGVVEKDKLNQAKLIKVKPNQALILNLRKNLVKVFEKSLPNPHSALVAGVSIGSKTNIDPIFWESLKKTGTAHVVVASGLNVTLVAGFLFGVLVVFLSRRRAILIATFGIWLYAFIAGFDAPIVRAAIMGSLAFLAQELGRLNFALRTLFVTGLVMILFKPEWVSDLGFWLSFAATISILIFNKKIEKLIDFIRIDFFREGLATTLAAQIGVAPILYASFGQFNILSPLINAAVLWTIPPITIIGMIGGILGLVNLTLGKIILWLSYPLTSWFVFTINLF
ncbi:hypothetical protein A2962_03535 [Candidatus Woesebacteria bacterium RIFCSPLOWO2_01_FULL_39_61]|uniref:ComEC/Rec2-related protein domain-containing protein n=1 Tax=Candidatus Woesebacteria bacterium RIFCSPHIGHO2_02_FULL_39_13 TaxID=1802505 RepID=A0A1F7Z389_9BACT|nr:MAG: hypothetical protein A2692_00665 [Candidatus Woesebacteria bacterium RIFCSPHIGHO2_01_FULL_39_95]OGM34123.1 MAG: hypothetical protein A3D01_00120 [Candidatus Woesebacteria bacterium RIFCSPHIGHO2_02_FULL_39_13]OGM38722.1 MAG: hypothetical protein A3E13_03855 [Candidatus Woesebacteria bacterium RIFCSPHIGHO2_12_FULL_40_20]OGM67583.1 MAG: hypothetical protein A2962_03535 [Candidatus Woesebacteria bacterium RIFCSPLOWO2_01_FULL_39_61]OGM75436.1 MAG: hypothetical protein A3H19_03615 [Candidatus